MNTEYRWIWSVLDESKMHLLYNPDDDEEEKEKEVARERIEEGNRWIWIYTGKRNGTSGETQIQLNDLSILLVNQQVAEGQKLR